MSNSESLPQHRETGKTRSQRIQIDYYRRRGGLYYFKWILSILALLASGVYAFYVVASPGAGRHVSTGPVALVHASFESDCSKCHQDFTPLATDAMQLDPLASLAHTESACQACHAVGDHYREVLTADWKAVDQNCAECHRDHQGRDHHFLEIANSTCTKCHSQLNAVCYADHQPRVAKSVTKFTKSEHGDFASLMQGDSGSIKFDHAQHLIAGQVKQDSKGGFTIAMLEPSQRERYRRPGQSDDALVEMDCSSCHVMDGNPDRVTSLAGDNELGRYMAPIRFDEHCGACHSMNPSGRGDATLPLPHAAPWAEIELLLEAKINGSLLRGENRLAGDDSQKIPRPGEGTGSPPVASELASASTVAAAISLVRQQCLKCHQVDALTDSSIASLTRSTSASLIPARWLKQGLYDHAAHRKIDCRYCHSAAYMDLQAAGMSDQNSVMIAGIDSCTGCHRDSSEPAGESLSGNTASLLDGQPNWASDRCTLCHRYHDSRPMANEARP